jgi:hypothetical protein
MFASNWRFKRLDAGELSAMLMFYMSLALLASVTQ